MKKLFSTLLILLLAFSLVFALTACGDDLEDEETSNNEDNKKPEGDKKPGGANPGGANPGGENPGGENPGGENPGGENPGGEHTCADTNGDTLCDTCSAFLCNGNHVDTDGDGFCNGKDCTYEMPAYDTYGHPLTKTAAVSNTCTENGNIEYWTCSVCSLIFSDRTASYTLTVDDIVVPAAHDIINHEAHISCTDISWNAYETCSRCSYSTYVEIPVQAEFHKVMLISQNCVALNDAYNPFEISSDGILISTNKDHASSSTYTITAIGSFTLSLQYAVSSENNYDYLAIMHNGTQIVRVSGEYSWTNLSIDMSAGDVVTFTYSKDGSSSNGSDCAGIRLAQGTVDATPEIISGLFTTCAADICCQVCNTVLVEHLPHEYINHEGSPVTCTTPGWEPYATCANCNFSSYEEIAALGHDIIYVDAYNNCTETSWEAFEYCSRCNYSTYEEIPARAQYHQVVLVNPYPEVSETYTVTNDSYYPFTVTEDGVIVSTNKDSHSSSSYTITATADITLGIEYTVSSEDGFDYLTILHNDSTVERVSGTNHTSWYYLSIPLATGDRLTFTYSKDGSNNHGNDCGYIRLAQHLDATPEIVSVLTTDCSADICCTNCNTVLVPRLPHEYINHEGQDPTCTEDGWHPYQTCANCDYSSYAAISALDHDYIYHEAYTNCAETSWNEYYTCSRCDYSTYEAIEPEYEYHQVWSGLGNLYTAVNDSSYPFSISSDGIITSTNHSGSTASTYTITAIVDFTLQIEYAVSSEGGCDYLTIRHNSAQISRIAGSYSCNTQSIELTAGDVVTFTYSKDGSVNSGSDCGYIRFTNDFADATEETLSGLTSSCTEDVTCLRCGIVLIERLGHDYVDHEAQAPTCTEIGWDAYQSCSRCNYSTYYQIDALNHDYVYHEAYTNCVETSWNEYYTCSRCDYSTYEAIEPQYEYHQVWSQLTNYYTAVNDSYYPFSISSDGIITSTNHSHSTSSTYTITALVDFTLQVEYTVSSESNYDYLRIRHNSTQLVGIAGSYSWNTISIDLMAGDIVTFTYSKDGSNNTGSDSAYIRFTNSLVDATEETLSGLTSSCTEDITCMRCGIVLIERLGHDYVDHEAQAPTCTEIGWDAYQSCSRCNYSTYYQIDALDHDYVYNDAYDNCTETSWNEYYTCSRCDYSTYEAIEPRYEYHQVIMQDSDFTQVNATEEVLSSLTSTCTEDLVCVICEAVLIERLGHDYVDHEAQAPTCTEIGWDAYQSCSRCNYSTYYQIDALNHDYVYHEAYTNCVETSWNEYYTCSRCDYSTYEAIEPQYEYHHIGTLNFTETNATNYPFAINNGVITSTNKSHGSSSIYTITACTSFTMELQYSVSSEGNFDYLTIRHNGSSLDSISGSVSLKTLSVNMSAGDVLTFTYSKDGSVSNGSDCGYVQILSPAPQNFIEATPENIYNYGILCTEDVTCLLCNAQFIEGTDDHSYIDVEAQAPTCTEIGWNAFQACENCSYNNCEVIDKLDHTFEGDTCSVCGTHIPTEGFTFTLSDDQSYYILSSAYYVTDTEIYIPERYEGLYVKEIAAEAFYYCENKANITSIIIPESVETIGYSAFYGCSSLTTITIPESVTAIAYYAFYDCTSLESIIFEDTENWYSTTESYNWTNKINGSELSVTDAAAIAQFAVEYYGYYWYKI